jgi:hypothetical protein
MSEKIQDEELEIVRDGDDLFIVADGVRIAKRGRPGSAQAKTWVSLEPGWRVLDRSAEEIVVEYSGVQVQH